VIIGSAILFINVWRLQTKKNVHSMDRFKGNSYPP